jgi:hypothetical protein
MITRKDKRKLEGNTNYFFEFLKIKEHFFKSMNLWLKKVTDHRHQSYKKYDSEVILFMMILKNAFNFKSMRSMTDELNQDQVIENLGRALGVDLEEIPHYDTINDFLVELPPEELEKIRTYMIKELLKKRCFEDYRINGKYWGIIFDGTGLFKFDEKHCKHCLRRKYTNEETGETKTIYMHHVLEAKLVVGDMVLSIGSEFIENESEDVTKQDCELKAFYRLSEKIKHTYPRLPICILGDSIYAAEPVFKLCDENKWMYLFRFKEGRIKSIANEYTKIKAIEGKDEDEDVVWVNEISYNDRKVNVFEGTVEDKKGVKRKYLFITNMRVTERNAGTMLSIGRSRWKIENQGFNTQKNIRYHIEHANSHNYNAMKNHYLLTQIADILVQLFENGLSIFRLVKKTAKEISSKLLEAIRTRGLTDEDILQIAKPAQVRFT